MAILASILVMLAVTLVPTLRSYLQQQSDYSALQAKVAQQRRSVDALTRGAGPVERPRLRRAAGARAAEVRAPGERSYTVIDADPAPRHTSDPRVAAAAPEDVQTRRGTASCGSPW